MRPPPIRSSTPSRSRPSKRAASALAARAVPRCARYHHQQPVEVRRTLVRRGGADMLQVAVDRIAQLPQAAERMHAQVREPTRFVAATLIFQPLDDDLVALGLHLAGDHGECDPVRDRAAFVEQVGRRRIGGVALVVKGERRAAGPRARRPVYFQFAGDIAFQSGLEISRGGELCEGGPQERTLCPFCRQTCC